MSANGVRFRAIAARAGGAAIGNRHRRLSSVAALPSFWYRFWGIRNRHHFDEARGENETTVGTDVARRALAAADLEPHQVDLALCSCSSPVLGATAGLPGRRAVPRLSAALQDSLGIRRGIDTQTDCIGFLTNLELGSSLIRAGAAQHVLVVASEYTSSGADFVDKFSTLPGDGAAAAVLSGCEARNDELCASSFLSKSDHYDLATARLERNRGYSIAARGSAYWPFFRQGDDGLSIMSTFVHQTVPAMVRSALDTAGVRKSEVDYFVFHQPSKTIIKAWTMALGVPRGRTMLTVVDHGIMISASLPLTLYKSIEQRRYRGSGTLVLAGAATGWNFGAQVWKPTGIALG